MSAMNIQTHLRRSAGAEPLNQRSRICAGWLVGVFAMVFAFTSHAEVRVPPHERVVLSNGTVLLITDRHDVPLINFQAVMRGGAMVDPTAKLGLASMTVSLFEKGAGKRSALQFAQTVASVGGTIETDASTESTSVSG